MNFAEKCISNMNALIQGISTLLDKVMSATDKIVENNNSLPAITALAAICFALISTLGGGSYKNIVGDFSNIFEFVMIMALIISALLLSSIVLSYLDDLLDFLPYEGEEVESKWRDWGTKTAALIIIVSAAFFALYMIGYGSIFFLNLEYIIKIMLSIFLIIMVIVSIIDSMVVANLLLGMVYLCVCAVLLNIYADAKKSAEIVDSQLCYLIYNGYQDGGGTENKKSEKFILNACQVLNDKGVDYMNLRVKVN